MCLMMNVCNFKSLYLNFFSVGSTPGGQDVLNFHDVGQVNQVVLHTLNMQSGHTYYVTVRGTN